MTAKKTHGQSQHPLMLFSAWNYKILAIGLVLIIVGFTAMYLENEVHGFISLFISPILIMAGYLSVILAIMKREGNGQEPHTHPSE